MSVKPNKSKKLKLIATATVVTLYTTVITSSTTAHASVRNVFARMWNNMKTCFGFCPPRPPRTSSLGDQGVGPQNLGMRARLKGWFGFGNGGGSGSSSPSASRLGGTNNVELHDITGKSSDSKSSSNSSTSKGSTAAGGHENVTFYDEYGNTFSGTVITDFTSHGIDRQISSGSSSSSGGSSAGRISTATAGSKGSNGSDKSLTSKLSDGVDRFQKLQNPENQNIPGPRTNINRFYKYTNISSSGGIDNKGFDGTGESSGGASTSPRPAKPTPPTSTTGGDSGEDTIQYANLKFKTGAGGGTKPTTTQDKTEYSTVRGSEKGTGGSSTGSVDYNKLGARPKTQGTSGGTGSGDKKVRFGDDNVKVSSRTTNDGTIIETNYDEKTGKQSLTVRPSSGKKSPPPVAPKPKFTPPTNSGGDKKTPPPVAPKPKLAHRSDGENNGENNGSKNYKLKTFV